MVAWSTTDKAANVTLSAGNLTATMSSSVQGGVRCDTSFAGGKLYYEVYATQVSNLQVGWANATQSLTAVIGGTTNGLGVDTPNNRIIINNVTIGAPENSGQQVVAPLVVGIAVDFTAKLIWVRLNNGLWNASLTANPATGTGGYSTATLGAGPYFPMFASVTSGCSVNARFGAADTMYAVPSGFSTLDTNVQAFEAVGKMSGIALLAPPQAAASSYKMSGIALLVPPQNAASCYKMSGYAILRPKNDNAPSKSRMFAYLRM